MSVQVTLMGVISEPVLRFTQAGKAVLSFSMVTKRSVKNQATNEWEDHEETWWQVTAWEKLAENCAESLSKGASVIVVGRTFMDKYVGKDGAERTSLKVSASAIGPDLRRATAQVRKVERSQSTGVDESDPWGKPAPSEDIPPF